MNGQFCVLEDGVRVHFSLKRRNRDRFYYVVFRGPNGLQNERSTKERGQRGAAETGIEIIKAEYRPQTAVSNPSWDEAITSLLEHLRAANLREPTVHDYEFAIRTLRSMYPQTHGPTEITPAMAERYKAKRLQAGLSPHSVRGDLTALKVTYGKWWVRTAKMISTNPFEAVERPKAERKPPRIISPQEFETFVGWLKKRWGNWRIPVLFLEVKSIIGCRITELASAKTESLADGRLHFVAETTKGRKQRALKLPAAIYTELASIAGPTYIFERFSGERRAIHHKRGNPHHAATIKPFTPQQLKQWLEDEVGLYFRTFPKLKRFKLHNLRGTAMSKALQAGIGYDAASIAFGCHPETMRQHYVNLNETAISDQVMDAIQKLNGHTPIVVESKPEETFGDSKSGGI